MDKKIGGALIGRGAFGCVFKPSLSCPGEKGGEEDLVSKVFFGEDSKKESKVEMRLNEKIKNIKGHEEWAHIWYKNCIPNKYDILYKEDPEIEDCLYDNDVSEGSFDKYRSMLQGSYAGMSLLDAILKEFKSPVFANKAKFTSKFLGICVVTSIFLLVKRFQAENGFRIFTSILVGNFGWFLLVSLLVKLGLLLVSY